MDICPNCSGNVDNLERHRVWCDPLTQISKGRAATVARVRADTAAMILDQEHDGEGSYQPTAADLKDQRNLG